MENKVETAEGDLLNLETPPNFSLVLPELPDKLQDKCQWQLIPAPSYSGTKLHQQSHARSKSQTDSFIRDMGEITLTSCSK